MGSGSTKPHQSYEVTPAADPDADKVSADSAPALPAELADSLALLHSMTWQPDADPHAHTSDLFAANVRWMARQLRTRQEA